MRAGPRSQPSGAGSGSDEQPAKWAARRGTAEIAMGRVRVLRIIVIIVTAV